MSKTYFSILSLAAVLGSSASAVTVAHDGLTSDRITATGGSGSTDLYGSGNDDAFASYGIVSFQFTAADFGLATVTDITTVSLELTFNDRGFSDGSQFNVWFTTDSQSDLGGSNYDNLSFDNTGAADPDGIVSSQFTDAPSFLGSSSLGFDPTDMANGGVAFDYSLSFTGTDETALLAEINSGSEFSIIISAADNADDITFSGVDNIFDPGDPALSIATVPEPSVAATLAIFGFAVLMRRRRVFKRS